MNHARIVSGPDDNIWIQLETIQKHELSVVLTHEQVRLILEDRVRLIEAKNELIRDLNHARSNAHGQ